VVRSRDGMVDITDLKSVADRRTGSSPVGSTTLKTFTKYVSIMKHHDENVRYNVHLNIYRKET
jgi:hypothetical protein